MKKESLCMHTFRRITYCGNNANIWQLNVSVGVLIINEMEIYVENLWGNKI